MGFDFSASRLLQTSVRTSLTGVLEASEKLACHILAHKMP